MSLLALPPLPNHLTTFLEFRGQVLAYVVDMLESSGRCACHQFVGTGKWVYDEYGSPKPEVHCFGVSERFFYLEKYKEPNELMEGAANRFLARHTALVWQGFYYKFMPPKPAADDKIVRKLYWSSVPDDELNGMLDDMRNGLLPDWRLEIHPVVSITSEGALPGGYGQNTNTMLLLEYENGDNWGRPRVIRFEEYGHPYDDPADAVVGVGTRIISSKPWDFTTQGSVPVHY